MTAFAYLVRYIYIYVSLIVFVTWVDSVQAVKSLNAAALFGHRNGAGCVCAHTEELQSVDGHSAAIDTLCGIQQQLHGVIAMTESLVI